MAGAAGERGQATVELVALLPLLAALVGGLWQAALAGQAAWSVGAAARAAARAEALGADPVAAARRALPARLEHGLTVATGESGAVRVSLGIPGVVGSGRVGTVRARAQFAAQR